MIDLPTFLCTFSWGVRIWCGRALVLCWRAALGCIGRSGIPARSRVFGSGHDARRSSIGLARTIRHQVR